MIWWPTPPPATEDHYNHAAYAVGDLGGVDRFSRSPPRRALNRSVLAQGPHTPLDEAASHPRPRWAACRSSPDRYIVGLMFWL